MYQMRRGVHPTEPDPHMSSYNPYDYHCPSQLPHFSMQYNRYDHSFSVSYHPYRFNHNPRRPRRSHLSNTRSNEPRFNQYSYSYRPTCRFRGTVDVGRPHNTGFTRFQPSKHNERIHANHSHHHRGGRATDVCGRIKHVKDQQFDRTIPTSTSPVHNSESDVSDIFTSKLTCTDVVDYNLREKLIDQLRNGSYQCMVCISPVRQADPIWSCSVCFHVYHLSCIKSWAATSSSSTQNSTNEGTQNGVSTVGSWRCPSCQTEICNKASDKAMEYRCFCGRLRNPEYHPARSSIPHGCDELCGKPRRPQSEDSHLFHLNPCIHPCTELCHPGPCPKCVATVVAHCPCGRVKHSVICGTAPPEPCGQTCDRSLSVTKEGQRLCVFDNVHYCIESCHVGDCPPCSWVFEADCYCCSEHNKFQCGSEDAEKLRIAPEVIDLARELAVNFYSGLTNKGDQCFSTKAILSPDVLEDGGLSTPQRDKSMDRLCLTSNNCIDRCSDTPNTDTIRILPPTISLGRSFSCSAICEQLLDCGKHTCPTICHPGECESCALNPKRCFTCPCGRVQLSRLVTSGDPSGNRTSCTDPVPLCTNVCSRPYMLCGHPCAIKCHEGPCPPCELTVTTQCRCGRTTKKMTCTEYGKMVKEQGSIQLICERVCKKKKACGRHKCTNECCDLSAHPCSEVCGRRLSCRMHNCEERCHLGPCGACWRGVIYDELTCRCGFTVLHPPQPCGTAPPECDRPCDRVHSCDHAVRHNCHSELTCPPCTVLLVKECPGGHGVQFNLPCFQPIQTCGRICGRPLVTCSHTCIRSCHPGDCPYFDKTSGALIPCTQPCSKPRPDCGHNCGLPCHDQRQLTCERAAELTKKGSSKQFVGLPPCRMLSELVCSCGRRKEKLACYQVQARKFALLQQKSSDSKTVGLQLEQDNDDSSVVKRKSTEYPTLLECNDECVRAEQAAMLADSRYANVATWTRSTSGDVEKKATLAAAFNPPEYQESLRQFATFNLAFASRIERQFEELVTKLINDPTESRSTAYYFKPMHKKRNRFVFDLAEFYGLEASMHDQKPERCVMVFGRRNTVHLPSHSLTECLKRESTDFIQLPDGVPLPTKADHRPILPSRSDVRKQQVGAPPSSMFSYANVLNQH